GLGISDTSESSSLSRFRDLPTQFARQPTKIALLLFEILHGIRSAFHIGRIGVRSVDDLDSDLIAHLKIRFDPSQMQRLSVVVSLQAAYLYAYAKFNWGFPRIWRWRLGDR